MNRLNLITVVLGLLTIAACKKSPIAEKTSPAAQTGNAVEECLPSMFNLAVDSATGSSYIFKVMGSPSAGPISVTPHVVSGNHQLKDCSGIPILRASGLSYDPTTGTFWGTTGITGSVPNAILRFTDPNCVTILPAVNSCGLALDLSDVERDQTTGIFYAINRGTVAPNNRIVRLGLPGSTIVNCLPNPLPVGVKMRGLTFDCNGQLYVMHTSGVFGTIISVNKVTGLISSSFPYSGPITSLAAIPTPELGLHYDCFCIKRFITGNVDPTTAPLMTDGMPAGLGGPFYNSVPGVLKPTVDFARP